LILDFLLTIVAVVLSYASPFFLKRVLEAVESPSPEALSKAYIYAILSYLASLLRSQFDLQHLWLARRASTRIRSELMTSIYDKALRRKDFSGVTNKDSDAGVGVGKSKGSKKGEKAKSGADVGKIVQLMSGDANRVAQVVTGSYLLYG
jgi:ABC-type multidrug transport system fused ATPase/permease subunit